LSPYASELEAFHQGEDAGGHAAGAAEVSLPMVLVRAFLVWLVIIAAETVHGILLVPIVGDLPARQIDILIGSLMIFAVAYLFIRWIAARTTLQLLGVGLLWVVLTVLFELGLGRLTSACRGSGSKTTT
jgi:hypothetical protein